MAKRVEDREGLSRAGAWVITRGADGPVVGKILASYPRDGAGTVYLGLWDWSQGNISSVLQEGHAGGYGYCKVSAILGRMTFAGHVIQEGNWEASFRDAGFGVMHLV